METLIVVSSYTLIFDLDKPLAGMLTIPLRKYNISRDYIETTEHEIYKEV